MNRLPIFTLFLLLLFSSASFSQKGYLFIKRGIKKKRVYTEGDPIRLRLIDGGIWSGTITMLRNDTIFLNGTPIHKTAVKQVILKKRKKTPFPDAKTVGLIAGGAALTSFGLTLNNKDPRLRKQAILAGPVIGFGPLLIKHFGGRLIRAIPRSKFRIGKRFYLQIIDFHIQKQPLKSF